MRRRESISSGNDVRDKAQFTIQGACGLAAVASRDKKVARILLYVVIKVNFARENGEWENRIKTQDITFAVIIPNGGRITNSGRTPGKFANSSRACALLSPACARAPTGELSYL